MKNKISSQFLMLFLLISFSQLFASMEEEKPLIKANAKLTDKELTLFIMGPSHLTASDGFETDFTDDGMEITSHFICQDYPPKNPAHISCLLSAKNENGSIDITIDETQVVRGQGWCSDRLLKKNASQSIHIEDNTLDLEFEPEMYTVKIIEPEKQTLKNTVMFKFKLLED